MTAAFSYWMASMMGNNSGSTEVRQSSPAVSGEQTMGENPCREIGLDTNSPALVATASASPAVSPAISPASPTPESRTTKIETTAQSKSGGQSGSQPQTLKPSCYKCEYRRDVPGSAHSACGHPEALYSAKRVLLQILDGPIEGRGTTRLDSGTMKIAANKHGIRSGWFMWPFNFDPIWLEECSGFAQKG